MITETNVDNVKLGACNVTYGGVDLGLTKGGVNVTISTQNKPINVDQFGQSVVNDFIMGRSVTIKVPMAESDLTKLAMVIPGSILIEDQTDSSKRLLNVSANVGTSLISLAMPLNLHPTANVADDLSEDVNAAIAAPVGNIAFDYEAENERIYTVEFHVYPNLATGALLSIGDPTAIALDNNTDLASENGTVIVTEDGTNLVV